MSKFMHSAYIPCILFASSLFAPPAKPPLRKLTSIELPGPKGKRFDYVTIRTTISSSWRTCTAIRPIL